MFEIKRPLIKTNTNYFAAFASTPCCFCNVSLSVHTKAFSSFTMSPLRIYSWYLGNGVSKICSAKYLFAGHYSFFIDLLSANLFFPTKIAGCLKGPFHVTLLTNAPVIEAKGLLHLLFLTELQLSLHHCHFVI